MVYKVINIILYIKAADMKKKKKRFPGVEDTTN